MVGPITFTCTCTDREKQGSVCASPNGITGVLFLYTHITEQHGFVRNLSWQRMINCPRLVHVPEIQFNSIQPYQAKQQKHTWHLSGGYCTVLGRSRRGEKSNLKVLSLLSRTQVRSSCRRSAAHRSIQHPPTRGEGASSSSSSPPPWNAAACGGWGCPVASPTTAQIYRLREGYKANPKPCGPTTAQPSRPAIPSWSPPPLPESDDGNAAADASGSGLVLLDRWCYIANLVNATTS